jgi:squalene cyclase
MPITENASSTEAIRRKLRALTAVRLDPAATEPERANAEGLKARLEKQLTEEATPEGKWTGIMFRLGRGVKEITSQPSPKGDWTDHAFRLGRMLRKGFKR